MPRHEKNQPHLPMSPRPWIRPFLTPIDSASTSTHMEVTAITNRPTPPTSHSPLMFDRCVIWTISDSSALLWLLYGCTPHPRHLGATLPEVAAFGCSTEGLHRSFFHFSTGERVFERDSHSWSRSGRIL